MKNLLEVFMFIIPFTLGTLSALLVNNLFSFFAGVIGMVSIKGLLFLYNKIK